MSKTRENYDPNFPVCSNQDDFNEAFRTAVKYSRKEEAVKMRPYAYTYMVLWVIFLVWALILAMQVPVGPSRVLHLVFAIVFAPAYVLGYYLGALNNKNDQVVPLSFY
jgi:archaellum biogenesis protein FlaJ (TadC family)